METEEVYDVLMEHLIGTIKGYDPHYKAKVKLAVEVIDNEFSKRKQFTAADINRHLEFDSNRYLKLLGRIGFLRKEAGAEKVAKYSRTDSWPPPVKFLKGTPTGTVYYLPNVFRIRSNSAVKIRAYLKPGGFHSPVSNHRCR